MRWEQFDWLIEAALAEDGARDDVTTRALVDPSLECEGEVLVNQDGVVCGLSLAARLCKLFDARLRFRPAVRDGAEARRDEIVATIAGPAASILSVERTLLNFLQRLSGIATLTQRFVEAVQGTGAKIIDTRKTTPGWRALAKYAVRCGGGTNHRMGLSDQVLIKDNHLHLWRSRGGEAGGAVASAIQEARREAGPLLVEVEVETIEDLGEALAGEPDIVLLDNMSPADVRRACEVVRAAALEGHRRARLEASGSIDLGNVRAYAEAGADRISVGALTHSAPAVDVSLRMR